MAYISLYRKWRPQAFSDVVGQPHIVRTLQNSLRQSRVNHAYLFTGPRGTGKTTVARLMAKGLNCQHGPTDTPCGSCNSCQEIARGSFLDVMEIDGASNRGIEEIRELRENVRYAPSEGRYKIYIIDEVHMLTTEAFNALLKTLEEPPEHVVFMFATTDPHKIPATILSRCQRYDFKRFSITQICERLQTVLEGENIKADSDALTVIAQHSQGGMRDALGVLDQCIAYSDQITLEVVSEVLGVAGPQVLERFSESLFAKRREESLEIINSLYDGGKDLSQFTRDVIGYLRQKLTQPGEDNIAELLRAIEELARCEQEFRYSFDQKIPLEMAVLRFIDLPDQLGRLQAEVESLREQLKELPTRTANSGGTAESEESRNLSHARLRMSEDDQERLEKIQAHWQEYLEALRDQRMIQPEAFLREGEPVALQGDVLTVGFPKERGFHKASIEQEKHRDPAERILYKVFGSQLKIRCVISNETSENSETIQSRPVEPASVKPATKTSPKPNPASSEAASEEQAHPGKKEEQLDSAVEAALKMFGGKVIQVKDNNEKGGE